MATFLPQLPVTLIVTFPQFLPLIVDISVEIIKSGFLPLTLIANFNYNSNVQNLASSFSEILIQFSSKFVHFRSLYIRFLSKGFEPETVQSFNWMWHFGRVDNLFLNGPTRPLIFGLFKQTSLQFYNISM